MGTEAKMIKINLEKAKEIHKNNLRAARAEEFKKLDVEALRAIEQGDTKKLEEITLLKTKLRDVTVAEEIQNSTSVEDLKMHWPSDIISTTSPYKT